MQNKVTVTIAGQEYNLVATEPAAYMKKVAAYVDEKMNEVLQSGRVSLTDAAILAAVNLADEYFKEQDASKHLRSQLKDYLEEATSLKMQLAEAKREIFGLQKRESQEGGRTAESKSRKSG